MTDFLTVVSGLPRSGTSMMMAALQAGGLPLVVDGVREADRHNPRGYFEHEGIKTLQDGGEWLNEHKGKAIKILFHLVKWIPDEVPIKVILMLRQLEEVVQSQDLMLARRPTQKTDWARLFGTQLEKLRSQLQQRENVQVLEVRYAAVLLDPDREFARVADFLQLPLEVSGMAATVDPTLYRNRLGAEVPTWTPATPD